MRRLSAAIETVGLAVASLLLLAMTCVIGGQVFSRKVLGQTPAWSTEIAVHAMVWMGLIGAALGVKSGSHIAVELVERRLPRRLRRAAAWIVTYGQVLTGIILIVWGTLLSVSLSGATTPGAKIPLSAVCLALPISGAMMLLFSVERHLSRRHTNDDR